MDNWPAPASRRAVTLERQKDPQLRQTMLDPDLIDSPLFYDDSWLPVGAAFEFGQSAAPAPGQPAAVRVASASDSGRIPVAKTLAAIDNQAVLIESANYLDLLPQLKAIQQAAAPRPGARTKALAAQERVIVRPSSAVAKEWPMRLAARPYQPRGLLLDYVQLSGSQNSFTFTNAATYCISNSFTVGLGTATFQQSAYLKFATNAYLLLYGPVSFPSSGSPDVFTSTDDNWYGDEISGSTSVPNYAASQAIWMYYQTVQTTVQNVLVRWAQRGIQYDENPGVYNSPALNSSAFKYSKTGAYVNVQNDTLSLSSDTDCCVGTPIDDYSGSVSGSLTTDCGVVSTALVNDPSLDQVSGEDTNKNSVSECSFVQVTRTNFVAAFFDTHLSEFALGSQTFPDITSPRSIDWASSTNGGASFTDQGPLQPSPPTDTTMGDAGDPVLARDSANGTIYLLGNPSRESGYQGFRLWKSTDAGQSFSLVNTNVPSGYSQADKPMLVVNNHPGLSTSTNLYVAGEMNSGSQVTTQVKIGPERA